MGFSRISVLIQPESERRGLDSVARKSRMTNNVIMSHARQHKTNATKQNFPV